MEDRSGVRAAAYKEREREDDIGVRLRECATNFFGREHGASNDNNHPPLARAGATGIQQRSCWTVGCIDGLGDDLGTTEHRLDVVSVWIQHKGRVITRVILLPQSRCAV